jgi:two-component system LytT family response regulator
MSMKVYLLDDEQNGIDVLEWHLKSMPEIVICGMQTDARKAIAEIQELKPDLLFLDIQMPEKNGFDVIESIKGPLPEIIFVTAYDQFAIKAIRFSAVDYLVKPVDVGELKAALAKAAEKLKGSKEPVDMQSLLYNIKMLQNHKPKLAVPAHDGVEYVPIEEIIHCKADDNYTDILLIDQRKITASKTLKDFEALLSDHSFLRIHQSHLINLGHVRKYIKSDGGSVQMENGDVLAISRAKKDQFLQMMGLA